MSKIIEVTTKNFQKEVIDSTIPVLVDFYTDNCGACIALNPILEELSETYAGKIHMTKFYVSIEEVLANSNEVMNKYDIMGFPTILIIQNGSVINSLLGSQTMDTLKESLEVI